MTADLKMAVVRDLRLAPTMRNVFTKASVVILENWPAPCGDPFCLLGPKDIGIKRHRGKSWGSLHPELPSSPSFPNLPDESVLGINQKPV